MPDAHTILLTYSALNRALLGNTRQARAEIAEALARAVDSARPHHVAVVLGYALRLHYCLGDEAEIEAQSDMLAKLASEHGFRQYKASAATWSAWLEARAGSTAGAVAMLEKGVSAYKATGAVWTVPFMLLQLAEVHRYAEEKAKVLETLDQALEWIERTQWYWLSAEAHRLRAEALQDLGDSEHAAELFHRSLRSARQHGARLWELRARTSFARLLLSQDNQSAARDLLAPVPGWFEQFETTDFNDAECLLEEIGLTPRLASPSNLS